MKNKLTPLRAIRKRCLDCQETTTDIRNCEHTDCALYRFRMGKGRASVKDIRRHCLQCMDGQADEVRLCPSEDCPLWTYRFGKNPAYKSKGNIEALQKARNILNKAKP